MSTAGHAVIVLAGDRGPQDPVAQHTGADCKALAPVGGTPLLWRVLDTLQRLDWREIVLVGPRRDVLDAHPEVADRLDAAGVTWLPPEPSPVASAVAGLKHLGPDVPALLTTADHALLQPAMVETLLAGGEHLDLAVALAPYARIRAAYPQARRTTLNLGRHGGYCGCNLFLVNSAAGRDLVADWHRVQSQRKHPARMIVRLLGLGAVARYALGRLSLDAAMARLSQRSGVRVGAVLLAQPEASIDVDSLADLRLVESILARRGRADPARQ